MNWFRLYSEFATDAKVQMMSEAMQRRFVMLLCIRSCNGLETFHGTKRDESVAFQLRISDAETADTKREFLSLGLIDDDWNPLKWSKRQYVSDSSTSRVRKHRDVVKRSKPSTTKQQGNVSVAPPDTDTDTETDKSKEQKQRDGKPSTLTLPSWLPESAWAEWHKFRNSRKGWTPRARELSLATLTNLRTKGHDPTAVIEQSIERGWTGLFELKTNARTDHGDSGASRRLSVVERVERNIAAHRERERDPGARVIDGTSTVVHA